MTKAIAEQRKTSSSRPGQATGGKGSRYAIDLLRAFGGAILFSFPMLMTMELWWLGFHMDPFRLALFILLNIPLLIGLSYYGGFEATSSRMADVLDAFAAYAVGFIAAAVMLALFGVIKFGMPANELIGKISVQAVPASIGAILARRQFEKVQKTEEKRRSARYGGALFLMAVGALYLSSSVASTEEMVLISYQMTPTHVFLLLVFSLLVMHAFVYAVMAQSETAVPFDTVTFWTVFARFTIVGYAIALLISVCILWIFERTDGMPLSQIIPATIVLGFPAALGAGAFRLIL
jgi:putative integral membrane protein (TIGR02587 family)